MVHLPLGALVLVPLLLIPAMALPKYAKGFAWSAMIVVAIGTLGAVLAVSTGDAATDSPGFSISAAGHDVLEEHEEMGETTRDIFLVLASTLFVALGAWAILGKRVKHWMFASAIGVYLIAYSIGLLGLANTGHEGGRLVHEFGVRANIGGVAPSGLTPTAPVRRHDDDD
jgi:hypothetical protein